MSCVRSPKNVRRISPPVHRLFLDAGAGSAQVLTGDRSQPDGRGPGRPNVIARYVWCMERTRRWGNLSASGEQVKSQTINPAPFEIDRRHNPVTTRRSPGKLSRKKMRIRELMSKKIRIVATVAVFGAAVALLFQARRPGRSRRSLPLLRVMLKPPPPCHRRLIAD